MAEETGTHESARAAILGWGALAVFALAFGAYIGAPLVIGERWSDKQNEAIEAVKDHKPTGGDTLYDLIRAYSLKAREIENAYIGEFSWSAIQQDGPEYEVTLLWTEDQTKKVALWRVNLETKDIRPQGDEAASLAPRLAAGPKPKPK